MGVFTDGAATIRAPRAAAHRLILRDLKVSLEDEDCRARLVAEKLLEEGLARVSEAAEIAEEHDVVAAAIIWSRVCLFGWKEEGSMSEAGVYLLGDFIL